MKLLLSDHISYQRRAYLLACLEHDLIVRACAASLPMCTFSGIGCPSHASRLTHTKDGCIYDAFPPTALSLSRSLFQAAKPQASCSSLKFKLNHGVQAVERVFQSITSTSMPAIRTPVGSTLALPLPHRFQPHAGINVQSRGSAALCFENHKKSRCPDDRRRLMRRSNRDEPATIRRADITRSEFGTKRSPY